MKNIIQYLQSDETKERIVSLINDNILLYQGINTDIQIQKYTGLIYNQFVKECVQNNQYVSLSNKTINAINEIYKQLVLNLRKISSKKYEIIELRCIVDEHRNKLVSALENNDYEDKKEQLFIPCAEYTGEFQNEILRTDLNQLHEPIIDIGCGLSYELIKLLRRNGYSKVYGLDQYVSNDSKVACSNWFDYSFQESTWGTIIAHMSFSNHLRRSIINSDEYKDTYMKKYYEILHSLKQDGVFIYTPSVKVIEDELNRSEYEIQYFRNVNDKNLDTVYIRKLL
ncbi:hypothetical protein [Treponema brennaborense]|uniref:Class I SAM-dependent methyltransferase n=1 Tax=Treponema brennaborense (strain DSM 12168 / CIP 105900 / DD5/3) TaxID=906968 RepID=F4LKS5_TREBD|nr:hypothetical protein [Treponema brennaborense]AEE15536.1 hypothetical protein Trebr_0080 [Treponema brennaborense DSM 12168]